MVSIDKFNKLSLDEKAWYIWNGATLLHVREDKTHRYNLFYMNNYYIELLYSIDDNEIDKIRAFFSDSFLTPYLQTINIEDLMN